MEQTYSNIAMQRTVDDHTNYMVSARASHELGQEITKYWSASNIM
jgi:hypothetical protein